MGLANLVREGGGEVIFEWPKEGTGWAQELVSRFIVDFDVHETLCDGCALGMLDLAFSRNLISEKLWNGGFDGSGQFCKS